MNAEYSSPTECGNRISRIIDSAAPLPCAIEEVVHSFLNNCVFGTVGWGNLTGICDPELDDLVGQLVSSTDPAQTEDLGKQVQERFAENLPYIPLMSPGGNFAYRPAAYDGWVYLKGTGIMTVWSFLPEGAQDIP